MVESERCRMLNRATIGDIQIGQSKLITWVTLDANISEKAAVKNNLWLRAS